MANEDEEFSWDDPGQGDLSTEIDLRKVELEIRKQEVANAKFIEALKIITTGVVVTLIPAIISGHIKDQEVEIQRLQEELSYLVNFSGKVVEEDDLISRRNYVEYLATIAHSSDSRKRWKAYLDIISKPAQELEKLDSEIAEVNAEAERLLLDVKNQVATDSTMSDLEELQKRLLSLDLQKKTIIERGRLTSPSALRALSDMNLTLKIPEAAISLIAKHEGFQPTAFPDPNTGGMPYSIGYGTSIYPDARPVKIGDRITEEMGREYLIWDINRRLQPSLQIIPNWSKMNDNQKGAIYSFAYNIGSSFYGNQSFSSITELLDSDDRWNDQEWVKETFLIYTNPGSEAEMGLRKRREEEAELFLKKE